jgi:hypothetical protein
MSARIVWINADGSLARVAGSIPRGNVTARRE